MSQYYDKASLVVVPSGYKAGTVYAQKPLTTDGQLAFTRTGDTATRVNSAGLIEKVRTNLVLQSNTYSTTWINSDSTETGGQAGYDGTNNAWLLTSTILGGFIYQTVSISGQTTFSVYAKAGSQNGIILYSVHVAQGRNFNLSTGAVGGAFVAAPESSQIQSVGNGWYRCSITISSSSTNHFRIYVGDGSSTALGNVVIQNSQCEKGDIATPYIPTTTAAVSVGPTANTARLDYLGSTCGKLLLEPQRTNIQINSEDFSQSNWDKTNTAIVVNQLASPDGFVNADKLNETAVNNLHQLESSRSVSASTVYTMSVFAKKAERSFVRVYDATTNNSAYFNLDSGTIGTISGPTATAKIENYGNGWYRCSVTYTETGTFGRYRITIAKQDNEASYLGVAGSGIYVWGAQYEAGAYPTSYIPTLAASATRGADACSKTGISSLIGQTEGTIFAEANIRANKESVRALQISDGTTNNRIQLAFINNDFSPAIVTGGVVQAGTTTPFTAGNNKFAIAYANNDVVAYLNGVQVLVDNLATIPACSVLDVGQSLSANSNTLGDPIAQALLFKTRLTNAELATLTAL